MNALETTHIALMLKSMNHGLTRDSIVDYGTCCSVQQKEKNNENNTECEDTEKANDNLQVEEQIQNVEQVHDLKKM